MHRSFNPEDMKRATAPYPELIPEDFDFEGWVGNENNVMLVEGESAGMAVMEYPGVYTGHYFFKVHGRDALRLANKMMNWMIENKEAKVFTGLTPTDRPHAQKFNRLLGFTSCGLVETVRGSEEMFCMTADELKEKQKETN